MSLFTIMSTARGVPITVNLDKYRRTLSSAKEIDFAGRDGDELPRLAVEARRATTDYAFRPRAMAIAAEAARRALGLNPFENQLIAALALGERNVIEMPTGEGKTLAAALAAAISLMEGRRVHIFTANDYLAARDAAWMGPLFTLLGFSTASISGPDGMEARRRAYGSDVLYLTARESGFDYLRDGLIYDKGERLRGELGHAIVDEADFVLIDEARVPLVIAARDAIEDGIGAKEADRIAASLEEGEDFVLNRRISQASISLAGLAKVEASLSGLPSSSDEAEGMRALGDMDPSLARVRVALHARAILRRDADYIVKDGQVRPIDEFTGRVAEQRRWPWGVQAALEVKEGLEPSPEGRIFGSITIEHLVALYPMLSAMTATALPAAEDFHTMYGLATVLIPPHLPSIRVDRPDAVFGTRRAARDALVEEVSKAREANRPALVGTESVLDSEEIAAALLERGIEASLLNAKNDEAEARIVAEAGKPGRVTVSTNMAGRGTDIKLGGKDGAVESAREAARAGGLLVIGFGRRESRRFDDQLRGRAGRQGEPGESRFFVSLEDPYFLRYGVKDFLPRAYREGREGPAGPSGSSEPIRDSRVLAELERAQSLVTNQKRLERKALRKYSLIVEFDRRWARELRDAALFDGVLPEALEPAIAALGAEGFSEEEARKEAVEAFLLRLDRAWSDHLLFVEELREGIGLERYAGHDPGMQYANRAGEAFLESMVEVLHAAARDLEPRTGSAEAASGRWARPRQPEPSSIWTYVVEEEEAPAFALSAIAPFALGEAIAQAFAQAFAVAALGLRSLFRGKRRGRRTAD